MDIDISCPHCLRIDAIQNVEALRAEGISTSYSTANYTGVGVSTTGLLPVIGTADIQRTHVTALAKRLAFAPAQQSAARLVSVGLLLVSPAFVMLILAALAASEPRESGLVITIIQTLMALVFMATPGAVVLALAAQRIRRNNRIARGRPAAYAVWRCAFYCFRCNVVYWPSAPAAGLPTRQALSLDHFRWYVWNTGGYLNV
ncbi:hypothetical protein [Nocardia brasiliensis]|uniref:Uncharacterized protein n=1 Tax=Nocardia brasiliensis (strain ATCC 700358 / HUJEG-1) TaxID=1133849 RepID=K0F124_NOCB7|nr:hypothetical protein [Nocardia brasiliensis]AFU02785.1 hypothetical protein O3I_024150 [Nocardia brasiliensis ATCC 700358]OCF85528.1 hypothetical protein AW168_35295 [Nocardia brasiliensis]